MQTTLRLSDNYLCDRILLGGGTAVPWRDARGRLQSALSLSGRVHYHWKFVRRPNGKLSVFPSLALWAPLLEKLQNFLFFFFFFCLKYTSQMGLVDIFVFFFFFFIYFYVYVPLKKRRLLLIALHAIHIELFCSLLRKRLRFSAIFLFSFSANVLPRC